MLASPKCPRAADAAVLSLGFRTMELIFRSSPGSVVVVVQSCPALCDPMDYSPPGSFLSMGLPRQEDWS